MFLQSLLGKSVHVSVIQHVCTSASSTILLPSGQMTWSTWERTLSQVSSGVRRLAYKMSTASLATICFWLYFSTDYFCWAEQSPIDRQPWLCTLNFFQDWNVLRRESKLLLVSELLPSSIVSLIYSSDFNSSHILLLPHTWVSLKGFMGRRAQSVHHDTYLWLLSISAITYEF